MKRIILSFLAGVALTLAVFGIPSAAYVVNSFKYSEIISDTADKWFFEGYNTATRNAHIITVNLTELKDQGYIDYGNNELIGFETVELTPVTYYYNGSALPGELGHKCIGFWTHTANGTPINWVSTSDPKLLKD